MNNPNINIDGKLTKIEPQGEKAVCLSIETPQQQYRLSISLQDWHAAYWSLLQYTRPANATEALETRKLQSQAWNRNIELCRRDQIDDNTLHLRQRMLSEVESVLYEDAKSTPAIMPYLLDLTVSFQVKGSNHELGRDLEKHFPAGMNDSETGQGFFYINHSLAVQVLDYLKDKVEWCGVSPTIGVTFKQPKQEQANQLATA